LLTTLPSTGFTKPLGGLDQRILHELQSKFAEFSALVNSKSSH
jgi:hypothetical protein